MYSGRTSIVLASLTILGLTSLSSAASAQAARKPGLWEMTTTMTMQQSPFPGGAPPAGLNTPLDGAPRTSQMCLTQAIIDRYGAPIPQSRNECSLQNVQKNDHGMTAELVCTGRMSGKGNLESTWPDPEHAKGSVHFVGIVQAGQRTLPLEWTSQSVSVFKSADCGDVKPLPMPDK